MSETFVGSVLEEILSKVKTLAAEEISLSWGLNDEVTKLGDSIAKIKAFLQDAEERQTSDNLAKLWLRRLDDVAHEADDAWDEITYETLRRKVEIWDRIWKRAINFFSFNSILFCPKMADKFKNILDSLDDLNKLATDYGLQQRIGGNRVIVTALNQDVSSATQALLNQMHQQGRLRDDECWSIIKARVSESSQMSHELELIGLRIAQQCRGVPLVARVAAGILCSIEMSPGEWLKIQQSDVWGSERSVLKLSFDHLSSPSLKKCFAYCAMFPKDYCFVKGQLIQLWMAQVYLGSSMQMVNIGDMYFNELLSHSLFQDVDTRRNIVTCKMHDSVRDLALSVSKFDTLNFSEGSTNTEDDLSHIRHLNVDDDGVHLPGILTAVAPKLRSLFSEIDVFKNQSRTFTSLRTLNFSGCNYSLDFPAFLGELKHLSSSIFGPTRQPTSS